jgi:Tol biopolymer transport system component/C-terminal processing protease CtpA/Prc
MVFDRWLLGPALACVFVTTSVALQDGVSPDWFRNPALSPDGKTIVFTHAGDLYSVPIEGGRAIPLTLHEADDTAPVWSPDGRLIAFASDRNGNYDVYVMPAEGGPATRLTFHSADDIPSAFTPDGAGVIFSSSRLGDAGSALFPAGPMSQLYRVDLEGGTPAMLLTSPALRARYDREGSRLVYEDRKGFESELRKHHRSSIARDVWIHDTRSGAHTRLTEFEGEDRDAHFSADGARIYFLSEREGDSNLFVMPAAGGAARRLTSFEHHPVRDLYVAADDRIVFSWHGDLYRLTPRGPELIPISIAVDGRGLEPARRAERGGATEFAVSPNGKEVAFVLRGEVFVTSTEFGTTRRITTTPEQERSVSFSPDGRTLLYAGERDGSWNLYETKLADEDELYFFSATKFDERPLLATEADEFQPQYSPDGKKVAYLHNRHTLKVLDIESGESVTALDGSWFYSYADGDHWFRWSPEGEWLAVHYYDRNRIWAGEIGLVRADGSSARPVNISNSGYDDNTPAWGMDGGVILWSTDRYGNKAHGSWGGHLDIAAAFLTQDAFDRFRMSKEEYQLNKELEEKRKEREKKEKDDAEKDDAEKQDGEPAPPDPDQPAGADDADRAPEGGDAGDDEGEAEDKPEPLKFEPEGLEARTVRLTRHASDLAGAELSPDGKKLYYLAKFEKGYDLWEQDYHEGSTKILAKLGAGSASMRMDPKGENLFVLADGALSKIALPSGERKGISFAAELIVDAHAERRHMFEHVRRQVEDKFYRDDLHGVDWDFYRSQYEAKLPGIHHNRQMSELLSELLGELNASHTGAYYRVPGRPGAASTAALGAFLEPVANGMRIVEIMDRSPLAKAALGIEPGMVITHVDGVEVTPTTNFHALLDAKAGVRVRLALAPAGDGDAIDRVVVPISLGEESQLRYERWVRQRRAIVDELSGGRLGYAHVRSMNDSSFRDFYAEVMGRSFDRKALIVDTRFNGGGWLHDDLVTFLSGKNYVNLYPRNDEDPRRQWAGDPYRRWDRPSIVVMSEGNYSDAHFFPWAYKELGIGETVGMPVPGTATAVWWETLHTGDIVFGIPQVGTKGVGGDYLENQQLEPDHTARITPEDAAAGRDTQIEKAVEVLLRGLRGQ